MFDSKNSTLSMNTQNDTNGSSISSFNSISNFNSLFDLTPQEINWKNQIEKKFEITEKDLDKFIALTPNEIKKEFRLTDEEITTLLAKVSYQIFIDKPPIGKSALDIRNEPTQSLRLSIGCPVLDKLLRGGLKVGITEIVGEASSGKTNLCLQMCLQVQLPKAFGGLEGLVCYISTEENVAWNKRLTETLIPAFKHRYPCVQDIDLSSNVLILKAKELEELQKILEEQLPSEIQKRNIKLVVIDSIAALYRFEFASDESFKRSRAMWRHSNQMKLLADAFEIPIVVVNQVSDLFINAPISDITSTKPQKIPALGLSWSNYVNTRIMLHRTQRTIVPPDYIASLEPDSDHPAMKKRKLEDDELGVATKRESLSQVPVRKMHIQLSSHLPNSICDFIITKDGVFGIQQE